MKAFFKAWLDQKNASESHSLGLDLNLSKADIHNQKQYKNIIL